MAVSVRISPRWVIAAASLAAVILTASLGFWQLRRAGMKESIQDMLKERMAMPALSERELREAEEQQNWEALHYRTGTVRGKWLDRGTIFLNNRPLNGQVGFIVVTPFELSGSKVVVLIQRGWVPRDPIHRERIPELVTPVGTIAVEGRFAPPPSRMYELGQDEKGRIRQNLSPADLSLELGVNVAPVSLLQFASQAPVESPVQDGLLRQWPVSFPDIHKHYGYAFQWFGLSALVMVLYVWFQIISPRKRASHA